MRTEHTDRIVKRAETVGMFIAEQGASIRHTASIFGISKSSIHRDINNVLPNVNPELYGEVTEVLLNNLAMRHVRGGESTRRKYKGDVS